MRMRHSASWIGIGVGLINSAGWISYHQSKYGAINGWLLPLDISMTLLVCYLGYLAGRQHDKANYLAEIDPLTNAYNRRVTELKFNKAIAAAPSGQQIIVYLADCDQFKKINDKYGHKVGDQVLYRIAQVLKRLAGPKDIVSRWGGDEFLIVRYGNGMADEWTLLMEKELRKLSLEAGFSVRLSIGQACYPEEATTLDDLVRIADDRMYVNKGNMFYSPSTWYEQS